MHEYAVIALRVSPDFRGEAGALPATARCSKVSRYRLTRSFSESPPTATWIVILQVLSARKQDLRQKCDLFLLFMSYQVV